MRYRHEACHRESAPRRRNFWGKNRESLGAIVGCTLAATLLLSCGDDVRNRARVVTRTHESDGGYQRDFDSGNGGRCVDQPWAVVFSMSLDASGVRSHASMDFLPSSRVQLTESVSSVAQGAPGSENLLAASLLSADQSILVQDVFGDPRVANADASRGNDSGFVQLALQLAPGTSRLVITDWNTGAVLVDLDLHGDLQLLCLNRPCLDLCASPDAGTSPALDASVDLPVAIDQAGDD